MIGDLCLDGKDREAQSRENLKLHHFDVTIGYRYQSSSRHFVGTVEQVQREILHNQIENDIHLFDVAINCRAGLDRASWRKTQILMALLTLVVSK